MTSATTDRRLGLTGGTAIKAPCKAATTANITLSAEQTVDGTSCVTGDRVLVKSQTDSTANGIYVVDTGTWTRDLDFDGTNDVVTGTIVMVLNGTTNGNTYWRVTTSGTITFGTSLITFAAALAGDATMVSFLPSGSGAVAEDVQTALRNYQANPKSYGLKIDGVTDDTAALQQLIDNMTAGSGGVIDFRGVPGTSIVQNIVLKEGVFLLGTGVMANSNNTPVNQLRMKASTTGVLIDTPATAIYSAGIQGFNLYGPGAAYACIGLRVQNGSRFQAKQLFVDNFADQGVQILSSSTACTFEDIFLQNCLLNTTRVQKDGVMDIDGNDHYLSRVESSGPPATGVWSSNLYVCAWVIRNNNSMFSQCIGEFADEGFYIVATNGAYNKFVACRADLNYGNGWDNAGGSNIFNACHGHNNSQDTTNTYDNFVAQSTSGNNVYTGCLASAAASMTKKAKYGFHDLLASGVSPNQYVNCLSFGAVTAEYLSTGSAGSSFQFPNNALKSMTAGTATPDVSGTINFQLNNTSAQDVTNFTGGVAGQIITIRAVNTNTTWKQGTTIKTTTGADVITVANKIYMFRNDGTAWWGIV